MFKGRLKGLTIYQSGKMCPSRRRFIVSLQGTLKSRVHPVQKLRPSEYLWTIPFVWSQHVHISVQDSLTVKHRFVRVTATFHHLYTTVWRHGNQGQNKETNDWVYSGEKLLCQNLPLTVQSLGVWLLSDIPDISVLSHRTIQLFFNLFTNSVAKKPKQSLVEWTKRYADVCA